MHRCMRTSSFRALILTIFLETHCPPGDREVSVVVLVAPIDQLHETNWQCTAPGEDGLRTAGSFAEARGSTRKTAILPYI